MRIGHALLAFAMVAWGYTGAEPTIYLSPADVGEGEPVEVEVSLAGKIGERRFRRNLHASTGALVGAVILLLAVTGMPWTIFWGANFHGFVASQQIGRPEELAGPAGEHDHDEHLPLSLRVRAPPLASGAGDLDPDRAIAATAGRGLTPWILDLPRQVGRPYRLSALAERTGDVRLISIDPGTGSVLQELRFADFGIGAQA